MRPELPPMRAEFGQMAEVSFMVKSDADAFGAQHQALDNVPGPSGFTAGAVGGSC